MAEGVDNLGVVVEVAGVALAEDRVLVAGLVVLVAHVDALGVAHVVVLGEVAVGVDVLVVAEVLRGGRAEGVGGEGVDGAAARVDVAREDAGERVHAVGAGGGHEQAGADVRELRKPVEFHDHGGVDEHDAVVEVVVDVLQDLELGRIGLEVVLDLVLSGVGVVVHGARRVAALARHALHDEDRRRVLGGVEHARALHDGDRALVEPEVLGVAEAHRARALDVVLAGALGVELLQRRVRTEAVGLEGGVERGARGGRAARCRSQHALRAAERAGVRAKEAELRALGQRQGVAVVLREDHALGGEATVEVLLGVLDRLAVVVGLAVVEVKPCGVQLRVVPGLAVAAQERIVHAAEARQHEVACRHEGGKNERERELEDALDHPPYLASRAYLLCHSFPFRLMRRQNAAQSNRLSSSAYFQPRAPGAL